MNVFVARQPIFDKNMSVFAYELLYRSEEGINDPSKDGDFKTGEVIFNALTCLGLDEILGGRKAFINFTKETISKDLPRLFSTEVLVVELLEDIVPDEAFIEQCLTLKESGYSLALDDFDTSYEFDNVVDIVNIIKVDFMLTTDDERIAMFEKYKDRNIKFLAEKVETKEEYEHAIELGFDYFQGYFFSKPVLVTGSDIKAFNATFALILQELSETEPSYENLEVIVKQDFSITFRLLKLVNSAAFYSRNRITSIKHALTMLGFKEIRKIFSLMMIRETGSDQPNELIRMSLIRGRMCELILKKTPLKRRASEGFLLGLFSCVDIILNKTMADAVVDLPLESDVLEALLDQESPFLDILNIIKNYEKGHWVQSKELFVDLNINFKTVADIYLEAIEWVNIIEKNG